MDDFIKCGCTRYKSPAEPCALYIFPIIIPTSVWEFRVPQAQCWGCCLFCAERAVYFPLPCRCAASCGGRGCGPKLCQECAISEWAGPSKGMGASSGTPEENIKKGSSYLGGGGEWRACQSTEISRQFLTTPGTVLSLWPPPALTGSLFSQEKAGGGWE